MSIYGWLKSLSRPRTGQKAVDTTAVETLINALKDDDPYVRRQAVIALGDLRDRRATVAVAGSLKDRDDDVRLEAVIALEKTGDPRAVEPLIEKLKSDDYFYVRKKAGYTLYGFLKQKDLGPRLREKILSHWRSWYLT